MLNTIFLQVSLYNNIFKDRLNDYIIFSYFNLSHIPVYNKSEADNFEIIWRNKGKSLYLKDVFKNWVENIVANGEICSSWTICHIFFHNVFKIVFLKYASESVCMWYLRLIYIYFCRDVFFVASCSNVCGKGLVNSRFMLQQYD